MDDDPRLERYLERLRSSFGGAVLTMKALCDANIIAFAFKGVAPRLDGQLLARRAQRLEARLGLPFTRYLSRLRGANGRGHARRGNARQLIIVP